MVWYVCMYICIAADEDEEEEVSFGWVFFSFRDEMVR